MTSWLDQFEPLDIIGNGSFGIIRKVRRKADGVILARKELHFERMAERDRKQIVAEVNILKDLYHENVVRYHDRYVDREAGILYILMEYCGGGDLSSVIKNCARYNTLLPEDKIWSYFLQLLLALNYCHHPNTKGSEGSTSSSSDSVGTKRQQILHRDLKPENVFLDGNDTIKLGDFGLAKALGQSSFANTYVGTPYYMSPELMQEKSYDTKSDIWSLGCLIYELCAMKPPFHEAKTHSELSLLIRNGRIPPLPKCYSHSLNQVIKAMLNLNPAMRPSAQQLLQHERIDFARKVADTQKTLNTIKSLKSAVSVKEKELQAVEAALIQRESQLAEVLAGKDVEIQNLTNLLADTDLAAQRAIKEAITKREDELRAAIVKREDEVRSAMAKREEEILEAVRKREEEINEAWVAREQELRQELQDAVDWVNRRQAELKEEEDTLQKAKDALAKEAEEVKQSKSTLSRIGRRGSPFGEVKNLIGPFARLHRADSLPADIHGPDHVRTSMERHPGLETPLNKGAASLATPNVAGRKPFIPHSAMRGVVLTSTGETLATPRVTELTKIITESPKVGLNFRKIFDFEGADVADSEQAKSGDEDDGHEEPPPSPSDRARSVKGDSNKSASSRPPSAAGTNRDLPPTRLRRPSIRTAPGSAARPLPYSSTCPVLPNGAAPSAAASTRPTSTQPTSTQAPSKTAAPSTPRYDTTDEENLPSPFLKRVERESLANPTGTLTGRGKRRSNGNVLRAMAAANSAQSLNSLVSSPSLATHSAAKLSS